MSLSSEWLSYALQVLPAGAPEAQRVETRRAFYAGAAAFMNTALAALTPVDGEPTAEELAAFDATVRELEAFARDVRGGRA